jgi:hypothetical protein
MSATLTVHDESLHGTKSNALTLAFLTERITVRELIRERVYEEVRQYNAARPEFFHGLVQPTDAEQTLNGYRVREKTAGERRKAIDWEAQYARAIEAFTRNGFFVLVDDRQVDSLDDVIEVRPGTQVSFVKLVPLVGG